MFFDPQLLHRELAALSPEPIIDDIELLTAEHTKTDQSCHEKDGQSIIRVDNESSCFFFPKR